MSDRRPGDVEQCEACGRPLDGKVYVVQVRQARGKKSGDGSDAGSRFVTCAWCAGRAVRYLDVLWRADRAR